MGTPINVAYVLPRSAVNGPGERFTVWVQGCPLACPGCWNRDTWDPAPRLLMTPSELLEQLDATPSVEGVTLTGGEPFEQAAALLPFVEGAVERGLTVFAFSGHELGELVTPAQRALLALVDVLVAGPYRAPLRTTELAWRGSTNQTVHRLSGRGRLLVEPDFACYEVHLDEQGSAAVTGFPPTPTRKALSLA